MRLLPVLLLLACPPKSDDSGPAEAEDSGDTADSGTDESGETGDSEPIVDEDRDGHTSDVDCDDNDYQTWPGAPEACDGEDDDCDDAIDEDYDADLDGHLDAALCATGDDCDDQDATVYPGAAETAYDDIDQDCDGDDLTDVDGDGFTTTFDCDDTNADVNPDALDLPKNGIDEDCSGADDLDEDDDGSDDEAYGGLDCDDADASVHPGARDWMGDGADDDCDGNDGLAALAADAPVTIAGVSGAQALVGQAVAVCDLDGDGWDDLLVSAPFYDSYAGALGVWYGDGSAAWSSGMVMSDADTLIASNDSFLGFDLVCADLDGDGNLDVATGRGEISYRPYYETEFGLVLWYGAGGRWAAMLDETDGVELSTALGAEDGVATVYGRSLAAGDIDADGAAELLIINDASDSLPNADDGVWILPGGRYTAAGDLDSLAEVRVWPDTAGATTKVQVLDDPEGDGDNLWFGQGNFSGDTSDTGRPGRATWALTPDETGLSMWDWAWATLEGDGHATFGWDLALDDFDGDGAEDAVIAAVTDATGATNAGGVYAYGTFAADLTGLGVDGASLADAHLGGATEDGYFGWIVLAVGDADGDGAADLLVSEPGGSSASGQVWLLSGARLMAGQALDDAALARWQGEAVDGFLANAMAVGDLDGDGEPDLVFAAYVQADDGSNENGRVYVSLSGT